MNSINETGAVPMPTIPFTHGIDLSSLQRDTERRTLADEEICLQVQGLNLYYGEKRALKARPKKGPETRSKTRPKTRTG